MPQAATIPLSAVPDPALGARAAAHLDLAFRRMLGGQGAETGPHFLRLVTGEAHPLGNVAVVTAPGDLGAMHAAVDPLLARGYPSSVLYTSGVSVDVAQALLAAGFADAGRMPAMAVDLAALAPTALPQGYAAGRVGAGDGRAWTDALATGYGLPRGLARMMSPECLPVDDAPDATLQFFAVRRGSTIVATSVLFLAAGLAGIYCVATLADERGRGLGAYVTAEPLRAARTLGYRVGVLQSSTAGHGVYLRLGFADVATVPMFVRMAS